MSNDRVMNTEICFINISYIIIAHIERVMFLHVDSLTGLAEVYLTKLWKLTFCVWLLLTENG